MLAFIRALLPASFAHVIILPHGCAWFVVSVFICLLGCLLPALQAKPPPLVQRLRKGRPRSPRPVSAETSTPERLEDGSPSSVKFAPALQRAATVAEASPSSSPFKRPAFKAIWSFAPGRSTSTHRQSEDDPTPIMRRAATLSSHVLPSATTLSHVLPSAATLSQVLPSAATMSHVLPSPPKLPTFKSMKSFSPTLRTGRTTPSAHSPISSESESTLVEHLSPARYHPDLSIIASATTSAEGTCVQQEDSEDSELAAPARAPSTSGSPHPSRSVRLPNMKLFRSLPPRTSCKPVAPRSSTPDACSEDDVSEPQAVPRDGEQAEQAQLRRDNTTGMLGDVFITKFVNPFRVKDRNAESVERAAPTSPLSPRRASGSRWMLASLHLGRRQSNGSRASSISDSPRSSISSGSTAYSTSSTSSSPSVTSESTPSGTSTTTPPKRSNGETHFAPTPTPRGRPMSRQPTSLWLGRAATMPKESGGEARNAAEPEEGQAVSQRKPFFRHRTSARGGKKWGSF
ncbi:hypothetical protein C8T65DRAFT_232072 [Cerioporus squamosus]|nr:hypothetical protein C8T65DRAFT_232072 [Cerioporus squamosus]